MKIADEKNFKNVVIICLIMIIIQFCSVIQADDMAEKSPDGGGADGGSSDFAAPGNTDGATKTAANMSDINNINNINLYRKLFQQKRLSHLEAVKTIVSIDSYEKQHKMVKIVLSKLFEVLVESKVKLMESSFMPGDPFPTSETVRDAFSKVVENTAFFGDLVLRLPDLIHSLLKTNKDWQMAVHWGVGFCNDSRVFTGKDALLLNTMAQELNIIERDPNFVNPYRDDSKQPEELNQELEKLIREEKMKAKRLKEKQEKRQKKGPRMTSNRRTEL